MTRAIIQNMAVNALNLGATEMLLVIPKEVYDKLEEELNVQYSTVVGKSTYMIFEDVISYGYAGLKIHFKER